MGNGLGVLTKNSTPCCYEKSTGSTQCQDFEQVETDNNLENKLTKSINDYNLTKREKEILNFILAGKTNREIAQMLYRTERTVEYHRNHLMQKLDTHSTVELVKRAITLGIA